MNSLKLLFILFALISSCAATTCKKICIFDNVKCVTRGGFNVYKKVVNGEKGLVPPLDPLYIEKIDGELESVQYKLTNITMIGLKHCEVTKINLNVNTNVYRQYVHCPTLISHFHFEAKEDSDTPGLRGKGVATVAAYDYDILNIGKYGVFVNEDHRPHFFVKTHESRTHLKGKLTFAITKFYIVDTRRVNETENYMNQHWRNTENFLHTPIVKRAMAILIKNIDIYIRKYNLGEVIPEHNEEL